MKKFLTSRCKPRNFFLTLFSHSNHTFNQKKKNFSDSTQPRHSNHKKSQGLHIKKPFQEQKIKMENALQLHETQNISSSSKTDILGKRELEDTSIKANIELEIEEIEQ